MTTTIGFIGGAARRPCRYRRRPRRGRRFLHVLPVLVTFLCGGCATLPDLAEPQPSYAAPRAETGLLADTGARIEASLTGQESAYWLLDNNADALLVRIALADLATETLDIQYFIWQDDMTGRLLMQHVLAAADRGVRVRFFVDDLTLAGRDEEIAGLDAHPFVDVRVFNPWTRRSSLLRPLQFVFRSRLLNHRMHNKIFVADGWFGILGGRNIGDRYFGVYDRFVQNDVDVMIAGPLLRDMIRSFDDYWNSELSFPVFWRDGRASELLGQLRNVSAAAVEAYAPLLSAFTPPEDRWRSYFADFTASPTRGPGELLLDSPNVHVELPVQLYARFREVLASAETEVVLSSPYLIPDREFVADLAKLVGRGVDVRIVTNSLASNSHIIAHSAYKKWRRALLATGAEIYEMRANAEVLEYFTTPPAEPDSLALHTKAFVVDRRRVFIGSPNVDPRSMILNTEIGLVADDPGLASEMLEILNRDMLPENAWRVTMDPEGWLEWSAGEETRSRQPAAGFGQRVIEFFMNLIPIKKQA
ncbi:MAG: phospholipase D family protein [Gammaproteobacteria bacterium]|nr:phospholipase D family protein [Gammaproteobacteria bacterium]